MASVSKMLHYFSAEIQGDKRTLQVILGESLKKLRKCKQRREPVDAEEVRHRIVAHHRIGYNMLLGSFLAYESGTGQLLVTDDDEAEELPLESLAPPVGEKGKRKEFLEGIVFFGVYKNHVIVLPSAGLRWKPFEQHLNWIASTADANNTLRIYFRQLAPKKVSQEIQRTGVRSISFGLPLLSSPGPRGSAQLRLPKNKRPARDDLIAEGDFDAQSPAMLFIKSLPGFKMPKRQDLEQALDSNLRVELRVYVRRKTNEDGQRVIDALGLNLRDSIDGVSVELRDGKTIMGNELKIQHRVTISAQHGLVEMSDVFEKMRDWLTELSEAGTVES